MPRRIEPRTTSPILDADDSPSATAADRRGGARLARPDGKHGVRSAMATRSRRPAARLDGPGDVRRSRFATGGSRVASGGAGTEIELLQRTFQPARTGLAPARGPDDDQLGLITLRVTEGEFYERFLGRALGMNLLATMAVDHGGPDPFDLSFWGAVDVAGRPDPDPASVDNREWLYQLPVTMIELQHHRTAVELAGPSPLIKIRLEVGRVDQLDALAERLGSVGVAVSGGLDGGLRFASVDGHRFSVVPGFSVIPGEA